MARFKRVAKSLDHLLEQVNRAYPDRRKGWDGALGDAAHSARKSDHNPDSRGIVHARDITHDPNRGFDSYLFAARLAKAADPRVKYIISNGRIHNPTFDKPGQWRRYHGANPHDHHVHVSVKSGRIEDDTRDWPGLTPLKPQAKAAEKETIMPILTKGNNATKRTIKPGETKRIPVGKHFSMAVLAKGQTVRPTVRIATTGAGETHVLEVSAKIVDYLKSARPQDKIVGNFFAEDFTGTHGGGWANHIYQPQPYLVSQTPRKGGSLRLQVQVKNRSNKTIEIRSTEFVVEGLK